MRTIFVNPSAVALDAPWPTIENVDVHGRVVACTPLHGATARGLREALTDVFEPAK